MRSTRASWMKYANSQRERKFNLKIETWTNKKESIGNLVDTPHLFFYLLTTFDVPLVALYTLCVSSPFAQDNEVDGRMKSRKMICRPSTYRQNLFDMGDGIISWWRTIFAPLPISFLFFVFFPFCTQLVLEDWKKKVNPRHFAFPCRVVWPCLSSPLYQTFESILLAKQLPVSVWHDCCHFPTAPPAPWKMCRNIPPTPFSKQKQDGPGLVSSSFWMSCTADVGCFLACKIYRTSGGWNTTKFKGGKEPEDTRVVLGWCPGFQ